MNDRRFVLITGASTGLGRACVEHLSTRGFDVIATVRSPDAAREIESHSNGRAKAILLDVTDRNAIERAVGEVEAIVGDAGLAGLVNNAGIAVFGPVEHVTAEDWRRQFDVNFFAPIDLIQHTLPLLRRRIATAGAWSARIVNMSSIAGRIGQPILSPYTSSKAALESMSDGLRIELHSQRIGVSLVEPGAIKSEIWTKAEKQADERRNDTRPREHYGKLIDAVETLAKQASANAIDPVHVARAVETCLTARRPPTRILVGRDAKGAAIMKRLLPDRLFDLGLRRLLRGANSST